MPLDTEKSMLDLIRQMYEEPADGEPELQVDPPLEAEYKSLLAVKKTLDRRPKQRPDTATIDAVLAAARYEATRARTRARWSDRFITTAAPLRLITQKRIVQSLSIAALTLVLITSTIWFLNTPTPSSIAPAVAPETQALNFRSEANEQGMALDDNAVALPGAISSERSQVDEKVVELPGETFASNEEEAEPTDFAFADRLGRLDAAAPVQLEAEEAFAPAEAFAVGESLAKEELRALDQIGKDLESLPAWDETDELRTLFVRVEALNTRSSGLQWDEPIPLEQIPQSAGARQPGHLQAGFKQ